MPSHLRNGKDLLFEQRRAAKRAAARDAGRIWQQQQLADLASRSSAPELPLLSAFHSYQELPNADGPASSIRKSRANNGLSAPGSAIDHPSVLGDQPAAVTISSILQGQWFLFINVQRRGNMSLMRTALLQAVSTQRTLASMYGTHCMMQVLDGWISREELSQLEQSTHLQTRRRQTQQQPSQEPMTPPPSPTATPPANGPLQGSQIQHPTAQEQHHVRLQPPLQSNHHHYAQHPRQNGSQFNPPYPRNRRLRYRGGRSNPNSSTAPLDQLPPNPQ
ncbi:hypothetical protein PCANC_16806 [Puccinia coronata f. sp. avenae]|uniref:Uncharacterized protein n=1 Tax=Puccinia coronata f. sp. avenae TaxID=200324 RepID=A0A2N5UL03_9BASI|nr:hypothetical protein PCASD_10352 [Puccinia coronata f. sp. avenae]PLW39478.1 hypothetical protein PCANC_16806 [Puccinia coronata f. sp. avenae]